MNPRFQTKYQKGDLIRVIQAPDQNTAHMKRFWNKLGIVIENVKTNSSPNIWEIWVDGRIINLHVLDFVKVEKQNDNHPTCSV
jgi:hypothetical protein